MRRNTLLIGLGSMILGGYFIATSTSPRINYSNAFIGIVFFVLGFVVTGRSTGRRANRIQLRVGLDPIALVLDGLFYLSILLGGLAGLVGSDQQSQNLAQFLLGLQTSALVMALLTRSITLNVAVGRKEFGKQIFFIMATLAGFFVMNLIVPPKLPVFFQSQSLATSGRFVTDTISIPEENLFRGWLAPWLGNISHTGIVGGAASSALLFMTYHLFVLGTNSSALFVVFGAGLISGFTALRTRLQSSTTVPHLFNNVISTGGF